MRVAVLGSDQRAKEFALGWKRAGHAVSLGADAPQPERFLIDANLSGLAVLSALEASHQADVIVLATEWSRTRACLRSLGNAAYKILLDATAPTSRELRASQAKPVDMGAKPVGLGTEPVDLRAEPVDSGAELIARWIPQASVVKIFNAVSARTIADPFYANQVHGVDITAMFFCGDDGSAKEAAKVLAHGLGFDPIDVGPLASARLLESFALLRLAVLNRNPNWSDVSFRLLRR